jgi:hypothetical protein
MIGTERDELVLSKHLPLKFLVPRAMAAVIDAHVCRAKTLPIGPRISLDDFAKMNEEERAEIDPEERAILERAQRLRSVHTTAARYERMSDEEKATLQPWERGILERELRLRRAGGVSWKRTLQEAEEHEEALRAAPAVRDPSLQQQRPEEIVSTEAEGRARREELMRTGHFAPQEATYLSIPAITWPIAEWTLGNRLRERLGVSLHELKGIATPMPGEELKMLQTLYEIVELAGEIGVPLLPMQFMFSAKHITNPFWAAEIYAAALCAGPGSELVLLSLISNSEFLAELNKVFRDPQLAYDRTMTLVYFNAALVSPVLFQALLNPEWVHVAFGPHVQLNEPMRDTGYFTESFTKGHHSRHHLRRGPVELQGGTVYIVFTINPLSREFRRPRTSLTVCFVRNLGVLLRAGESPVYLGGSRRRERNLDPIVRLVLETPHSAVRSIYPLTYENMLLFFTELMNQQLGALCADGLEDYLLLYLFLDSRLIETLPHNAFIAYLKAWGAWERLGRFPGTFQTLNIAASSDFDYVSQHFRAFCRALGTIFHKAHDPTLALDVIMQRVETIAFVAANAISVQDNVIIFCAQMDENIIKTAAYSLGAENASIYLQSGVLHTPQLYAALPKASRISLSRSRLRIAYGTLLQSLLVPRAEAEFIYNLHSLLLPRVTDVCDAIFSALIHNLIPPARPVADFDEIVDLYIHVFIKHRAENRMLTTKNRFPSSDQAPLADAFDESAIVKLFGDVMRLGATLVHLARILAAVYTELMSLDNHGITLWLSAVDKVRPKPSTHLAETLLFSFRNVLRASNSKDLQALSLHAENFQTAVQQILANAAAPPLAQP